MTTSNAETRSRMVGATEVEPVRRRQFPSGSGVSLGRIFGVQLQLDWSLLIIFALLTMSLGTAVFPAWHPDWSALLSWGVAAGAAVLFLASVLAHELSHALVARAQGIPVRRITLFVFGGVAHMEREPPSPKSEFLMAIVGPLMSLAIGVAAWLLGTYLAAPALANVETLEDARRAFTAVGPFATLLLWLGPINVLLGVFNLVPGFPLDGGRVFRSIVWWATNDLVKATRWAAAMGQLCAFALMTLGFWNVLSGGVGNGLWLLLIGWFLNNAAKMSYEQLLMRRALQGVAVRDLMFVHLETVPPQLTIRDLVRDHVMASDQRAFPVQDGQRFLGLVCLEDVRRVPQERWDTTRVEEIMTPLPEVVTVSPDAGAERALDLMTRRDVDQIPVLSLQDRLMGLVRRRDILKWLALRDPHATSAEAHLPRAPA